MMLLITSCSKDRNKELIGVWQRTDSNLNFNNKLVLGKDNSGLFIHTTYGESGEVASSVKSFMWSVKDDILTISESDISGSEQKYQINFETKCISKSLEDIKFEKTSSDYSKYY